METTLFHADIAGRLAALGTTTRVVSRLVNTDYDPVRFGDPTVGRVRLWLARVLDGWTARHLTHRVYANSEAVRVAAARDLGVAADSIPVVLECRDPARLGHPSEERRRRARAALDLDETHEVLVNIGRQDYQKGQRHLLRALAILAPSRPRLVLLIAGRAGDASAELESLCDGLGLRDRVRLLGHRDDVPEILAAGDIFVFPSLYEGLPGAVIEAMALGLPIVASDIDPVRETVDDGTHALLVRRESPPDIAEAVRRLLTEREVARSFGARNRARFEERYVIEGSTARAASLYRQIVSEA